MSDRRRDARDRTDRLRPRARAELGAAMAWRRFGVGDLAEPHRDIGGPRDGGASAHTAARRLAGRASERGRQKGAVAYCPRPVWSESAGKIRKTSGRATERLFA